MLEIYFFLWCFSFLLFGSRFISLFTTTPKQQNITQTHKQKGSGWQRTPSFFSLFFFSVFFSSLVSLASPFDVDAPLIINTSSIYTHTHIVDINSYFFLAVELSLYNASISSAYFFITIGRFNFNVGVNSPPGIYDGNENKMNLFVNIVFSSILLRSQSPRCRIFGFCSRSTQQLQSWLF